MTGIIYKAASGALLQQMRLDSLSNNLANVNTVGFKADKPVFRVDAVQNLITTPPAADRLSPYTPPMEQVTDFSEGQLKQTGNPLDVAILGSGFFEVRTPDGPQYTRKGSFSINERGILSTPEGWPVMGQGGEIVIESGTLEINEEGEILIDGVVQGALRILDFPKPYDLRKTGDTLFVPAKTDIRSEQAQDYSISQGFVEGSNVNAIRTMTDIIETMRVFESYQRIIRFADETLSKTVNEVGRNV